MKDITIICFPMLTLHLGKFWFISYRLKCCHPVKLQDFLTIISGIKVSISFIFCTEISIKER